MARLSGPFIVFDDARPGGSARLFSEPRHIIQTRDPEPVRACLDQLRAADGPVAGFLSYEAGYALEEKLRPLRHAPDETMPPLLWFAHFGRDEQIEIGDFLPDPAGAHAAPFKPLVTRAAYEEAAARVHEHILAGDIYQANLTFQAELSFIGHPLALYAAVRRRARAGHAALVFTGAHWILSFSPELFFTLEDGQVRTRPMKGTAVRRPDPAQDAAEAETLRTDPKQRAENLMIVDLLRNDLSRLARTGSVKVPDLFRVETYPTVHQMTSTVTAELEEGRGAWDLIEAIFPCGSITGAPKIRAMEIISDLETVPRGVYCGTIGWVEPGGDAAFNVAIRTLTIRAGEGTARLGLGSGLVADSRAADEWRECLAKGAFLDMSDRRFDLIETMRFDPHDGVIELERHLARLKRSAEAVGFAFDRHAARNELQAATFGAGLSRVRLLLARSGALAVELRPLEPPPSEPVDVKVMPLPVSSDDFRLRHKTSDRDFYGAARAAAGTFEVLFADPDGFLTEGSFTSLFVERDGRLLTPPLSRGLLPGVLRERLIESGEATEADLTEEDLADGFFIGNSLHDLIRARLA